MTLCASPPTGLTVLELTAEGVRLLDQTALPGRLDYVSVKTPEAMAEAIVTMIVRGAPAIGIAGAFGLVLSARQHSHLPLETMKAQILYDAQHLGETRPTAVNLAWALERMRAVLLDPALKDSQALLNALTEKANALYAQDLATNQAIGRNGAAIVPPSARILTHCNAGALATAGYGTALGVVRAAFEKDPSLHVYADETRPRLQGAKLTAWELQQEGIPVTLLADGMSGSLMQAGLVDLVIVGADRIAANGDTANKIGTYNLAIVAQAHHVPFYVAAPLSTVDLTIAEGAQIPIEMRDPAEIARIGDERICPEGVGFYNPAFDVTPARYISGIITEQGIARPDFVESLARLG